MKKIIVTLIVITTFASAPLFIISCGKSNADPKEQTNGKIAGQPVNVKVQEIRLQDFTETIRVTGSIESFNDIMVPAEEGGRVVVWTVPRGAHVAKDQIIARLDDALLKAGFEAAEANYKLADVTYEKQKKVFEEQAISDWQMKSFEYQRDAAKAQRDLAKARFDKTQIKSPVNGIINQRLVDAGEMIGPGMPIAQIVDNKKLRISAGVPERYAKSLHTGSHVGFTCDAFPTEQFHGTVSFVGAAVTKDNRTLPIEVQVTNNTSKLKPDMIASLSILTDAKKNCVVIPHDYIQQTDMNRFVVFVDNNGIAEERKVTFIGSDGKNVLITGGLKEGDKLITLGFQNVANGQKIAVQN